MPSLPEFINAFGKKRTVKVFRHFNAHHFTETADDIHNTRKFTIKLQCIKQSCNNNDCTAVIFRMIIDCIYKNCRTVCNDNLFENTPKHPPYAAHKCIIIKLFTFNKLCTKLIESCNRTFNYSEHK